MATENKITAGGVIGQETPENNLNDSFQYGGDANDMKKTVKKAAGKSSQQFAKYSVADLARAARSRFNVPPEIVTAAMRMDGKQKADISEAKDIIDKFMAREVK